MRCGYARFTPTLVQPNAERPHAAGVPFWKEYPGDEQRLSAHPMRATGGKPHMVITTEILAVIGGITLVLTAAVRVPAALAEFLQACILAATTARELRAALRPTQVPPLAPAPAWAARNHSQVGLWPPPEDLDANLNKSVGRAGSMRQARPPGRNCGKADHAVIGHGDWIMDNLHWHSREGMATAIHRNPELTTVTGACEFLDADVTAC